MQTLTQIETQTVSGGLTREDTQLITGMLAGAVSGGNGFIMGAVGWLAGKYYDFQSGVSFDAPSGYLSNHLTTAQYRQMQTTR